MKTIYVSLSVVREEIRKILSPEFCNELLEKLSERGTSVPVGAVGDAEKLAKWLSEEQFYAVEEFIDEIRRFFFGGEEVSATEVDKEKMATLIKNFKPLFAAAGVSTDILDVLNSLPDQIVWTARAKGSIEALEELLPDLKRVVGRVVADHLKWLQGEGGSSQAEAKELAGAIVDGVLRILHNDGLLTVSVGDLPTDTRRRLSSLL